MPNDRSRHYNADVDDSDSAHSVDSTGKRKSFRRLITRFAEKTSMQGVPYINNAKLLVAKIIWSFLLLCALVALGVHLWFLITQYYSWPIQTNVDLGYSNLQFPDITICNTNPIHNGRLFEMASARKLKQLIDDLNPRNLVPEQFDVNYDPSLSSSTQTTTGQRRSQVRRKRFVDQYDELNLTQYDENFIQPEQDVGSNEFDGKRSSTSDIQEVFEELFMDLLKGVRASIGHKISDMLLSCTFNDRVCDTRLFQLHQTSQYGNCWVLSSDRFTVQASGPSGGLSLILYLESQQYLKGISTGYGARVQIHEPGTIPYPGEEGLFIPSSMETDIGLKMTTIDRIGGKFGDCAKGDEFDRSYRRKYTRRACQRLCEMRSVVDECGCFSDRHEEIAIVRNNTLKPCRSNKEKRCEARVLRQFDLKYSGCDCPNPCKEISYSRSITSRQWPSDDFSLVLLQSICSVDREACATLRSIINEQRLLNYNFMKLNIYYEDLNFQNITEEPEIALAQFLSDIGGAVGLWIGLSILSFCEILQLIVELCDYFVNRTVKRRRREKRRASRRANNIHENRTKHDDKHSHPHGEGHKHHGEHHKPNSSHDPGLDSSRSMSRNLSVDGLHPRKVSPLNDRRFNHYNESHGYDSGHIRHGANEGRHYRYNDDYSRLNHVTGLS